VGLGPGPPRANVVTDMWIFKHKFKADGTVKGSVGSTGVHPAPGVDNDEIFSTVVKPASVWTVQTLAVSRGWLVH
jgi:hypothetical protein